MEFPTRCLQMYQSISVLRVVGWYFSFFSSNFNKTFCMQTVETYQTPRAAASDQGLQCLPMSHKKDVRLKLVKNIMSVRVGEA